jgi:hypothetical protein
MFIRQRVRHKAGGPRVYFTALRAVRTKAGPRQVTVASERVFRAQESSRTLDTPVLPAGRRAPALAGIRSTGRARTHGAAAQACRLNR